MTRWKHVKWTEAGQLTDILGWPAEPNGKQAPEAFFDGLRAAGRHHDAAMFIGQALPRFEAVTWAAHSVRELAKPDTPRGDADALKSAFLWLQDPSDNRRRAALDASAEADDVSPERLCALAVYFSGGSLAPDNLQPVLPPKDAAGKFAAGAVIVAAVGSGRRIEALETALDLGEALASGSLPPKS